MDFKKIIFGVIIVIILYIFYTSVFADKSKTNLVDLHNAKGNSQIIASKKLSGPTSTNYTYSFWIYINDFNYRYGDEKIILQRKNIDDDKQPLYLPKISLGENQNDIKVTINQVTKTDNTSDTHDIVVHSIPLQKWNHFIMTKSGDTIDIYIDGKLVKTSIMQNVAARIAGGTDIELTPGQEDDSGFAGYISKVNYFSNAINTREAYQLYKEGYGSGMLGDFFNRFKLKFAFMQDNQEKSSIIL